MNDFLSLFSLEGKVAVISGGAGQYGKQFVKGLAMAGAKVYMASRNMLANETAARELQEQGLKVYAAYLDLEDEASILALRDYVYSQEGKVDILINNSVARTMNGYSDTKERFDKSMTINATGLFLITRAFGDRMCQNGAPPDYFFHKGGMTNYTRYIASHYGKHGVRCNVLELGGLYNNQPETFVKHYSDSTCLGRMASDTDVLGSVIFLASDASSYITGAVIPVDGGYTAK